MKRWIELALVVLMSAAIFGGFALADAPTIIPRGFLRLSGGTMTGALTLSGTAAPALDITGVASGSTAIRLADGQRITWGSDLMITDSASRLAILVGANFSSDVDAVGNVVTGGNFTGDATTTTLDITSDTTATTMSTTVAAITLAPTATPDANDLIVEVNNAAAASLFTVDLEGDGVFTGDVSIAGNDLTGTGTGATFLITGNANDATTSTTVASVTVKAGAAIAAADLVFDVQSIGGGSNLNVDNSGVVTAVAKFRIGTGTAITAIDKGTITLSGGTGTATVADAAICVCTDTTANVSVKCAVSGTTLTATGTTSDVIAYICLDS